MNILHNSYYRFGFDFLGLILFLLAVVFATAFAVCYPIFAVVIFIIK